MKTVHHLILTGILTVSFCGRASAVPINFQLDNVTIVGATMASTQTYVPGFPITGSGDIDFGLGTGWLSLSDHSIIIDIEVTGPGADAQIDVSGWGQTITSIDVSGNITSTGSGAYSCPYVPETCTVGPPANTGWPPADGGSPSSAVIDTGLQTITVIDNSNDAYTGTVTQLYSYTIVPTPEPGTATLVGGGLVVFGLISRRRRA
jgi:hypothetical protein